MKEYRNKVELIGTVGSVIVTEINDQFVMRISLCIQEIFSLKDGSDMVNTTWLQVCHWTKDKALAESVKKGDWISVTGKIRNSHYVAASGRETAVAEILAQTLTIEN